jgi:hypothetical protein
LLGYCVRAKVASQRAALVVERNVRYQRGGDRRSWKFAHESWVEGQEYLDKSRALQDKIAANGAIKPKRNRCGLKKRMQNLPPKRGSASGPSMTPLNRSKKSLLRLAGGLIALRSLTR